MPDAQGRAVVPVAEVAVEAYRAVFGRGRLGLLFDLAWLPLLVMLGAALVPGYVRLYLGWHGIPAWAGDQFNLGIEDLIEALAGLVCLNAFAVRWHQAMLFSGETKPPRGLFLRAFTRFLAYSLLLYVVTATVFTAMLVADAIDLAAYFAPLAGALALLVWAGMVRCSLLFPAAAYGQPLGLAASWRAMRGNTWRLLGCGFVTCAPVVVAVVFLLSGIFAVLGLADHPNDLPLGFFILRGVAGTFSNFFVVALGASVLSLFYRRILLRGLGRF